MSRLLALGVGGTIQPWKALGLSCTDASVQLADVVLHCEPDSAAGLTWWSFTSDRDVDVLVDGIPTRLRSDAPSPATRESPIGSFSVVGVDHVVVNTSDGERTSNAIEEILGLELRRIRELPRGMEQRFHRADNMIIEVVSGPHISGDHASLWGMVASVDDLEGLAKTLGEDVVSVPKQATQPGRLISTVRRGHDGGVPFALMTPHVSGTPTRQ